MRIAAQTGIFSYHRAGKLPVLMDINLDCVFKAMYRVGGCNKETECSGRLNPLALRESSRTKKNEISEILRVLEGYLAFQIS